MGTQWQGMGKKMLEIDVFRESILKSDAILKPYNIHLYDLLMNSDESSLDDIVNSFVGIAATQVYCNTLLPGRVAQSVTCLATDACLTADPGVASSIPVRPHTFVEIVHEMISTVILLLPLIHSRRVVVSYK